MKAITIRQPFAGLVALGLKRCEHRPWNTDFRGLIAIHASLISYDIMARDADCYTVPELRATGGIVGVAVLKETIAIDNVFHWRFEHANPVSFMGCRGNQGLWELPEELRVTLERRST